MLGGLVACLAGVFILKAMEPAGEPPSDDPSEGVLLGVRLTTRWGTGGGVPPVL